MRYAVLHGDQTGEEMMVDALRVLEPLGLTPVDFDLSLENRKKTNNQVVHDAAKEIVSCGVGIKAATATADEMGSPNRILREDMNAGVIIRQGQPLPGIRPLAGLQFPITIVRMATGDAYGAEEKRGGSGLDEYAQRCERITRRACRTVAEYAFLSARAQDARVYGGPKWTVSPIYEAMLKEELDRAHANNPDIEYWPVLIDATYAGLINGSVADKPLVIPALNRDGDCLADLVLPLYGSIAGAGSQILSFSGDEYKVSAALHEAAHGTAPTLEGMNVANPLAMILACAGVVETLESQGATGLLYTGKDIKDAAYKAIEEGCKTQDLGGDYSMSGFTDEVIKRLPL